jgi:hypothetical protein
MTNKTATHVKSLNERQALYRLSEPVQYGWSDDGQTTTFVVASLALGWTGVSTGRGSFAAGFFGGNPTECLVFPARADGEIIEMCEIGGSYDCPGGHQEALEGMGFALLFEPQPVTIDV